MSTLRTLLLIAGGSLAVVPATPPLAWIGFATETMEAHRFERVAAAELPAGSQLPFGEVSPTIMVAPDGQVIAATLNDESLDAVQTRAALALVRSWRFRPFTWHGEPVIAMGRMSVGFHAAGGWRDAASAFPPVEPGKLAITLTRSACYGACPDYRVTIKGMDRRFSRPSNGAWMTWRRFIDHTHRRPACSCPAFIADTSTQR